MHTFHPIKISPHDKLITLIGSNPHVLLLLEHLNLPLLVGNQKIESYCTKNNIDTNLFITLLTLYIGLPLPTDISLPASELPSIVKLLKNSHHYYLHEKYIEIKNKIHEMHLVNPEPELSWVEKFFEDYMAEVREHLDYEEHTAFPYFLSLTQGKMSNNFQFSAKDYLNHHSDIEIKLADLKQLLLAHLPVAEDYKARRQTLQCLMELEFDLKVHTLIEEKILVPLVIQLEEQLK